MRNLGKAQFVHLWSRGISWESSWRTHFQLGLITSCVWCLRVPWTPSLLFLYVVSPPSEPFLMTCAFYSMAVSGWWDFLLGSSRVIIPGRNSKVSYGLASVVPEPYFHPIQLAKQIIQAGPHWRGRGWRRSRFYLFLGELHGQTGRVEINGGHLKAVIAGENIF